MYFLESACRIQIDAQASGEVNLIGPAPMEANKNAMEMATAGQSAANLAWPALLRKLDRQNPGYAD